jgi:hypothetical protein
LKGIHIAYIDIDIYNSMEWNATPKKSTRDVVSLSSAPSSSSATPFSSGSCKRRFVNTDLATTSSTSTSAYGVTVGQDNSIFLDCQSLQHSLKRVRLSSSPGELRLQRDLRHLVLSCRWVPVDEDLWCLEPTTGSTGASNNNRSNSNNNNNNSGIQLQRLTTATLKLQVVLPRHHNSTTANAATTPTSTVAHVWLQIPRLYPHRPPVVTRIAYDSSTSSSLKPKPQHQHQYHQQYHHEPKQQQHTQHTNVIMHCDVPSKDCAYSGLPWFPQDDNDNLGVEGQFGLCPQLQEEPQSQQAHSSRIHSLVFTAMDESMLAAGAPLPPYQQDQQEQQQEQQQRTVYAPWSPIQRLGDALECIIQLLVDNNNDNENGIDDSAHSAATNFTTNHANATATMENGNATTAMDRRDDRNHNWPEKESATCCRNGNGNNNGNISGHDVSPPEADRATEKQRAYQQQEHQHGQMRRRRPMSFDSNGLDFQADGNNNDNDDDDDANLAAFPPNRFDQGYERESVSALSAMDVSN